MPAQLLSLADGPSLLLDKPVLLVGRHEECDLQLNSRKVSRKHCVIAQVGETLIIRDLGSTNGVRINGARVAEGTLRTGDELAIGNFRYKVHVEQRRVVMPAPPLKEKALVTEDDMLEAADEPVPLPEPRPAGPVGPRADSYPMPEDLRVRTESSLPLPPPVK
jgi:pSer/pThr/pTyr-binding forkhead associated (FHA) protein